MKDEERMSGTERDDVDWATAAEQSSEDDESQTRNMLSHDEDSVVPAEQRPVHLVDDTEVDLKAVQDARPIPNDPEADAVLEDAPDIDSSEKAEAAAEATV